MGHSHVVGQPGSVLIGYMVGGGTVEGVRAGGTNANFLSHHGKATHPSISFLPQPVVWARVIRARVIRARVKGLLASVIPLALHCRRPLLVGNDNALYMVGGGTVAKGQDGERAHLD